MWNQSSILQSRHFVIIFSLKAYIIAAKICLWQCINPQERLENSWTDEQFLYGQGRYKYLSIKPEITLWFRANTQRTTDNNPYKPPNSLAFSKYVLPTSFFLKLLGPQLETKKPSQQWAQISGKYSDNQDRSPLLQLFLGCQSPRSRACKPWEEEEEGIFFQEIDQALSVAPSCLWCLCRQIEGKSHEGHRRAKWFVQFSRIEGSLSYPLRNRSVLRASPAEAVACLFYFHSRLLNLSYPDSSF